MIAGSPRERARPVAGADRRIRRELRRLPLRLRRSHVRGVAPLDRAVRRTGDAAPARESSRRRRIVFTKGPAPCRSPSSFRAACRSRRSPRRCSSSPTRTSWWKPAAPASSARFRRSIAAAAPTMRHWLVEIRERLDRIERETGRADRAVRREPDRAQEQSAPAGRSRNFDQAQGAADHHLARRREGAGRRGAGLWRAGVPRRDQHAPRAQGGGSRRRRADRGVRRRGRPCRPAQPVRADPGNPPVLRQDDPALRRDVHRAPHRGRAHARRRPRLSRHALHRDARKHGAAAASRT